MKRYMVQITNKALTDMEEIYNYIADHLQAPEAAMKQYDRIANSIETLDTFPERVMLMETDEDLELGLRKMPVDNFSVFFLIREEKVIVTNVLYSASDIIKRLRD